MIPAVPQKMARHTPCQSTSFFLFVRAVRSQIRTPLWLSWTPSLQRPDPDSSCVRGCVRSFRIPKAVFHVACFHCLWREKNETFRCDFLVLLTSFSLLSAATPGGRGAPGGAHQPVGSPAASACHVLGGRPASGKRLVGVRVADRRAGREPDG